MRSFSVLYGPRLGMGVATPFSDMAAHSCIAPTLAWDIHRGPLANNITATSSALGQVDASFIHKHKYVRSLFPSNTIILYNRVKKNHQINHTEESFTRVTENQIGMFYVLLDKFNIQLATIPVVPNLGYMYHMLYSSK